MRSSSTRKNYSSEEFLAEILDVLYEISKVLFNERGGKLKKILVLVEECRELLDKLEDSVQN